MNLMTSKLARKLPQALLLLVGLSLPVQAQNNTVSVPAGFVRVAIAGNANVPLTLPLDALDSGIQSVFSNQLTGGENTNTADRIQKWLTASQAYTNAWKFTNGLWYEDFTMFQTSPLSFLPGEGFWVRNAQVETQEVFLCGNLVLDAVMTNAVLFGQNLLGYPYATAIPVNQTDFTSDGAYGDAILTNADQVSSWQATNQNYATYYLGTNGLWQNSNGVATAASLGLGQGWWYERKLTNAMEWTEPRPYGNPFPDNSNPPAIVDMILNSNKDELTLTIEATGVAGEKLELYYKDMVTTGGLATSSGWTIAQTNTATSGQTLIAWTDNGTQTAGKVNTVPARFYLVGRGDLDTDGDGLSDARETFVLGTSPADSDSDDDGLSDGAEVGTYGTNPLDEDSDGDGVSDGQEVELGRNPMGTDAVSAIPFAETFETNSVGTNVWIDGINGWKVTPPSSAWVQSNDVYEGTQALQMDSGTNPADSTVGQLFENNTNPVLWVDCWLKPIPATAPTGTLNTSASLYFNTNGQLVVKNSNTWQVVTNHAPVAATNWARLTLKLDYGQSNWLACLNGTGVVSGLALGGSLSELTALQVKGQEGFLDNLLIMPYTPEGIDQDADGLRDTWELWHFASLSHGGSEDGDSDGLTNLEEQEYDGDPNSADTDGDGLTDGAEVETYGTNPASRDTDQDGMNDKAEIDFGMSATNANAYSRYPFEERFETNTVGLESWVNGTNGWVAFPTNSAWAQSNVVYEGAQSLAMDSGTNAECWARQLFQDGYADAIWVDAYVLAGRTVAPTGTLNTSASLYFNTNGQLVVKNSNTWQVVTNHAPVAADAWARLTVKLDYANSNWLVCLNNTGLVSNLALGQPRQNFAGFQMNAGSAYADKISVGVTSHTDIRVFP